MCSNYQDNTVAEIVSAVVQNEKFFENMTPEEKVKSVVDLYKALSQAVGATADHGHDHSGHSHSIIKVQKPIER
ncbi:MAG: hypothetical protein ACM3ZQ_06090 [Bacillota bacterium]